MHAGIAGGSAGVVDAGRTAVQRGLAGLTGRTAAGGIRVRETLIVVWIRPDPADMPVRIAGHLADAVYALGCTAKRRITSQTAGAAVILIVIGIAVGGPTAFADVVASRALVDALTVHTG